MLSRWRKLDKTSLSGKTLFQCAICERESPTPDKECPTMDCRAIEKRVRVWEEEEEEAVNRAARERELRRMEQLNVRRERFIEMYMTYATCGPDIQEIQLCMDAHTRGRIHHSVWNWITWLLITLAETPKPSAAAGRVGMTKAIPHDASQLIGVDVVKEEVQDMVRTMRRVEDEAK